MSDHKPYWHELSKEEVDGLIKEGITWEQVMERYDQPSWCSYFQALCGAMGCWSLTIPEIRPKISKEFCKDCDCFIKLK